jgi:flagellar motor switch protein FliM
MANNLSHKKIKQILAAAGKTETPDSENIETEEFSWNQPHYFNSTELEKLNQLLEKIVAKTSDQFSSLYQTECEVSLHSNEQFFAEQALDNNYESDKIYYYSAFGKHSYGLCGMIAFPCETAKELTSQLLGEDSGDKEEKLSELEESILLDISGSFIKAINKANRKFAFEIPGWISRNTIPLKVKDYEPMCQLTFEVGKKGAENPSQVPLLILSSQLKEGLGNNISSEGNVDKKQLKKAIEERIKEMNVTLTAELDSPTLSFEEIMNLQAGDVLILDKNVDQPIEIKAEGITICSAKPVQCSGYYGAAVTKMKEA